MKRAIGMAIFCCLMGALSSPSKSKEIIKKGDVAEFSPDIRKISAVIGEGVKLELVLIPAGKFIMGSPATEAWRKVDETQHEVVLTKPYYMGKYEVTQEQWEVIMKNNPSVIKGANLPVTDVSWIECQEFIKKLNVKLGGGFRLPTESEWEYACRAGTITAFSFGKDFNIFNANVSDSRKDEPVAVGSYNPNAFGLYDMHGNVYEWCEDWYGAYSKEKVTDPKGALKGVVRVLRGGSFGNGWRGARSSFRHFLAPTDRDGGSGFRLVKTK